MRCHHAGGEIPPRFQPKPGSGAVYRTSDRPQLWVLGAAIRADPWLRVAAVLGVPLVLIAILDMIQSQSVGLSELVNCTWGKGTSEPEARLTAGD